MFFPQSLTGQQVEEFVPKPLPLIRQLTEVKQIHIFRDRWDWIHHSRIGQLKPATWPLFLFRASRSVCHGVLHRHASEAAGINRSLRQFAILAAEPPPFPKLLSVERTERPAAASIAMNSLSNPRQAAAQLLNFGLILSTAFMVRVWTLTGAPLPTLFTYVLVSDRRIDVERPLRVHRQPLADRSRSLR